MNVGKMIRGVEISALLLLLSAIGASRVFACACGCNAFTVGAQWMMPIASRSTLSLQYDYMDQRSNWGNWKSLPAEENPDQEIRTHFYTAGFQFMADRDWGITAEIPVWNRYLRTIGEGGSVETVDHLSLGDVRITGLYTGLSEDMSTGIQLGLKLPTGPFTQSLLDRDAQIGSGTTDLLFGGYRMEQEQGWGWFVHLLWEHPLYSRVGYRPGDNFDVTAGIHYDDLLNTIHILPALQIAGSFRGIDRGEAATPENTGYERMFISPGVEIVASNNLTFYADFKIPIITHVRGVQLVAPSLMSITIGYSL